MMIQITKLLANGRNDFSFLCIDGCHCFPKLGWLSDPSGLIVRPCGPPVSWSYWNSQATLTTWAIGLIIRYPSGLIVRPKCPPVSYHLHPGNLWQHWLILPIINALVCSAISDPENILIKVIKHCIFRNLKAILYGEKQSTCLIFPKAHKFICQGLDALSGSEQYSECTH